MILSVRGFCSAGKMKVSTRTIELVVFFSYDIFLQTVHSKQANRALKRKELLKREEKRRIEAKVSDTSTTRPRYETSFNE